MAENETTAPPLITTLHLGSAQEQVVDVPSRKIILHENAALHEVLKFAENSNVWQMVPSIPTEKLQSKIEKCTDVALNPESFLNDPIPSILKCDKAKGQSRSWKFSSSAEKEKVTNDVAAYLETIRGTQATKNWIKYVTDEFFTNAIFNAPFFDDTVTLDRTSIVVLDPDKSAELFLATTENTLLLGCIDYFGNLNCAHLLQHLSKLSEHASTLVPNSGRGGAGIGLFQVLQNSAEFYAICEVNVRSFVGYVLPLGVSSKSIRNQSKQIHFHSYQDVQIGQMSVRVEKRGDWALLTCSGTLAENSGQLDSDLTGVHTVCFDFSRLVNLTKETSAHVKSWVQAVSRGRNSTILSGSLD